MSDPLHDSRNPNHGRIGGLIRTAPHTHKWSGWKEIGRTGDWFHPLIVERKCETCGARETDEH